MRRVLALLVIVVAALAAVVASVGPCDAPPDAADEVPAETPQGHAVRTGTAAPGAPRPRVRAAADGASSAESRAAGDASDADAADVTTPRFPVQVRVVAAATRAPVAGAEVVVDGRPGTTDGAGEATIKGVRRGWRAAVVTARGFAPETWWLEVRRDASPQVVALLPGVVVPIEVTDAVTGRPVAGAEVSLQSRATPEFRPGSESGSDRTSGLVRIVTDAAGRADACLPAETSVRAMTRAERHVTGFDVCRTPAEGTPPATFRIALAPAGTLRGVVRDPDGAPVAGATVSVVCASEGADGSLESAATGADGAYAIEGLILGASYVASAGKPSQVHAPWVGSADSAPIVPTRERPECVADLRLRRPGAVELVVVGEAGEALEDVSMKLSHAGGSRSRWGGGGSMSDDGLTPARYTLRASAPERVPVEETFDVAESATATRRIVLTRGVAVNGTVVDTDGAPVDGAGVRTRGQTDADFGASPASARTDKSGQFSLARLRIGAYDLLIDPPYEFEGVVVSGVTAPSAGLRIVVRRRGTLSLHAVFEEDAKPEPDARIAFHGALDDDPWHIDRVLPGDGLFEVAWPAGARGEVGIAVDGFVAVTRWIDVPTGAKVDLGEVRFRRGVALEGVVRDASGNPLTNFRVSAPDSWRGGSCRIAGDGGFRLNGLPAGSVRIEVDSKPPCSFHVSLPRREPIVLVHPGAGTLQVVVLDRAGAPIPGRQLVVRDAEGAPIDDGTTDIHGVWTATVATGRIVVEADGVPSAEAEVRRGDVTLVKLR